MKKSPHQTHQWHQLSPDYVLSVAKIIEICRVSERTARRWLKDGDAPYHFWKLIDLHQRGRILPESWNHCFINGNGNLEAHQVGEISQHQILQSQWYANLFRDQVRSLQKELDKANARIEWLEQCLDESRKELGQLPAANDKWRQ